MNLYIIPAYQETIRNKGYGKIISAAKKKKYNIIVLNLQLKNKSLKELVKQGENIIGKDKNSVIFGFSTGALIAFCISKKIPFKKGIYASISPILGKDAQKNLRINQKYLGKKTVEELVKTKYGKILTKYPIFMCGDSESNNLPERTKKIYRSNTGKLVILKDTRHDLTDGYLDEIISVI